MGEMVGERTGVEYLRLSSVRELFILPQRRWIVMNSLALKIVDDLFKFGRFVVVIIIMTAVSIQNESLTALTRKAVAFDLLLTLHIPYWQFLSLVVGNDQLLRERVGLKGKLPPLVVRRRRSSASAVGTTAAQ